MSRTTFAGLTASSGTRVQGLVRVPRIDPPWEVPAFVVKGSSPGLTLAVTAGIHAAEYAGIAAATRLARDVDARRLRGTLIVVSPVNTPGFYERSIYINPRDARNINRAFPGRTDGDPAERLAHFITTELLEGVDAYVDLHGGDLIESLVPFAIYQRTGDPALDNRSGALAEAYDLDYVLAVPADAVPGASYTAASRMGVPAIIAEAGGQGIYEHESVNRHLQGLYNVLIHLGMLDGSATRKTTPTALNSFAWLHADEAATYHPTVKVGETVEEGQVVGELRDLFGGTLHDLRAPVSGPVLFCVTALAVRKGDPLLGIGGR